MLKFIQILEYVLSKHDSALFFIIFYQSQDLSLIQPKVYQLVFLFECHSIWNFPKEAPY